MAFSPDGSILISVGADAPKTLCVWTLDFAERQLRLMHEEHLIPRTCAPPVADDDERALDGPKSYPSDCILGLARGEAADEILRRR